MPRILSPGLGHEALLRRRLLGPDLIVHVLPTHFEQPVPQNSAAVLVCAGAAGTVGGAAPLHRLHAAWMVASSCTTPSNVSSLACAASTLAASLSSTVVLVSGCGRSARTSRLPHSYPIAT